MATLNPYISFKSEAAEALEFYRSVLGGTVETMTLESMGDVMGPVPPEAKDLIMHGSLTLDDGLVLMASDTPPGMDHIAPTAGVTVAMTSADPADQPRFAEYFAKLSEGGTPGMPFEQAPWGDYFGQFDDKFGVSWMFDVASEQSASS
ncbi:VOC family protein [Nocardioides sp. CCNWLW239]|uniref:VOC family protein n=1 Tax=Nocardioides sp. CCNWLW239 TaxID=3128902 RepID=UPI003019742E